MVAIEVDDDRIERPGSRRFRHHVVEQLLQLRGFVEIAREQRVRHELLAVGGSRDGFGQVGRFAAHRREHVVARRRRLPHRARHPLEAGAAAAAERHVHRRLQALRQQLVVELAGDDELVEVVRRQPFGIDPARLRRRLRPEQDHGSGSANLLLQLAAKQGAEIQVRIVEPGLQAGGGQGRLDLSRQEAVLRRVRDECVHAGAPADLPLQTRTSAAGGRPVVLFNAIARQREPVSGTPKEVVTTAGGPDA